MLCIFCLKERPPSEEHVFPDVIGGTLTIDRVCRSCNDRLNKRADDGLIQHPLIRLARARLGIPDRRGNRLDLFADIFGKGVIVGGEHGGQEVLARTDPLTNRPTLKLVRHRNEKVQPGSSSATEIHVDSRDADRIPLIIQRERKRAGRPPLSKEALDRAVLRVHARGLTEIRHPVVRHEIDLRPTDPNRGMLKIVYELAWYWLGDDYLDDEGAAGLRSVILSDGPVDDPKLPSIIGEFSSGEVVRPLALWNDLADAHLASMNRAQNRVGIAIRVFQALSAIVIVSEQARRYKHVMERDYRGEFIKLDPVTRAANESTLGAAVGELLRDRRK